MISLRSKITQAVLSYFMLHNNAEMYVNEMSRRFNLDSGNLTRKLLELEEEGILKSRNIGDQKHYRLNKAFPLIKEYKKIVLKTIGIEHVLKKALSKIQGVERALLFGSYAKDRMDQSSDIDLIVIGNHNNIALQKEIAEIQKSIEREINLISMTAGEYKRKKDKDGLLRSIELEPRIRLA